jgi:molybdate transport system permease protein
MNRRPPLALLLPAILATAFLAVPLIAVLVRTTWRSWLHQVWTPAVRTALGLSLECSLSALGVCLILGVPLAWVLARCEFRGKGLLRALVLGPLVLPPVVGGVALLLAFGRRGLIPLHLSFSTGGAIAAEAFVALPFLVLAVEGALLGVDRDYEDVAATLGRSRLSAFLTVSLPLAAPGVAAGAALAWARALGEFGATITFAGSLPGKTETLPLAVYLTLQDDPAAAVSLSALLLAVSIGVLVCLRGRWRVSR